MGKFTIEEPFETKPPRLKDLVNKHIMGDVWIRDSPFGSVTDSLILAEKFDMQHKNVLRAITKCKKELGEIRKYKLEENLIESEYKKDKRKARKVDISEFGLALLVLYINTPKARMISAEIVYRFIILKTYVEGLTDNQIGAIKSYYKKQLKDN